MKFEKTLEINSSDILQCTELDNNILFRKYDVKEGSKIKLLENQFLLLTEYSKILDIENEEGTYKVTFGDSTKIELENEWKNILIKNSEENPLSVIFLNKKIIKKNKYFIIEPIKYKESYIKVKGNFDFYIINPVNFFEKVIGLRNHFSKQELIERVRTYIVKSIEKAIKEYIEKYNFEIKDLPKKSKEYKIKLPENEYNTKILSYGVKIESVDIEEVEITFKKRKLFKNKSGE